MSSYLRKLTFILITILGFTACDNSVDPVIEEVEFTSFDVGEFLDYLNSLEADKRQDAVDVYMDSLVSAPVIYDSVVYFIYNRNQQAVSVAGDFNGWSDATNLLTNVSGTTFWYTRLVFETNARLDYKFVADGQWLLDPNNPNQIPGGFGLNSELAMPAYVQPWEIEDLGNPDGSIESFTLSSSNTSATYSVDVYLPPGYDANSAYPSVYVHDGAEYLILGDSRNVINNLIAENLIEPVIAVFVSPTNRGAEYAFDKRFQFSSFITTELVPHIDANYATIQTAEKRAVFGASFGGNISAIISYYNPTIFGNMGLHSGAFWPNDHEMTQVITSGPDVNVKVASIWGTYEPGIAYDMNIVKDYMLTKNYELFWKELPEGHSWGLWRASIDDILVFFFPKQ